LLCEIVDILLCLSNRNHNSVEGILNKTHWRWASHYLDSHSTY